MRFLLLYSRFVLKRQTSKHGHSFKFIGAMRMYTSDSTSRDQNTVSLYQTTTDWLIVNPFTVPNDYWLTDCKSIGQLNPSLPLTFLRRSISTALSKIECSTQVAKEINKLGFVILCQQACGGITSKYNFLFRFTRNAWTTQTSTLPNWNGEQKWIWTV